MYLSYSHSVCPPYIITDNTEYYLSHLHEVSMMLQYTACCLPSILVALPWVYPTETKTGRQKVRNTLMINPLGLIITLHLLSFISLYLYLQSSNFIISWTTYDPLRSRQITIYFTYSNPAVFFNEISDFYKLQHSNHR